LALVSGAGLLAWRFADDREDDPSEPPVTAVAPLDVAPVAPDAELATSSVVADDPWAVERTEPKPPPVLELEGPSVSIDEARKGIAAAFQKVPADTRVLFGVSLVELRANDQFDEILGKIKQTPLVVALLGTTPPCVTSILSGSDWAVFAAKSLEDSSNATMILRGRYTRADIEKCFAEDSKKLEMPDGKTMLQLQRVGWLDFPDEHTVYISVRDDLAAAQVHGLVARGTGPTTRTKQLLAKLPADRSLVVVIDGSNGLEWPKNYLPKGSDVTAWLRVGTYSDLEVIADAHDETDAKAVVAAVKPQFEAIFGDKKSEFLGTMSIDRVKTTMRIRGKLSAILVAMIGGQIP
jgi:hypothetical protein